MRASVCISALLWASAAQRMLARGDEPHVGIESAHLYGNINKYAYYFADLLIGSPVPQRTSVIVDTGSRLVGFPCSGCSHCGNHLDPAFDFSSSSSARWLGCERECAAKCVHGHCPYNESYSEGSSISGFWFDDLVELGDPLQKNPPIRTQLGCHRNENKLFYTQRANGIMGLAPTELGLNRPAILQDLFRDKKHVRTDIFSMCLATWGGRLTVGGYNTSYHRHSGADGVTWISMRASQNYFIYPKSVYLDEKVHMIGADGDSFGASIVDSGTTYTYFPRPLFHALTDSLDEYCAKHDGCGANPEHGGCYRLVDPLAGPTLFPPMRFQFSDHEILWSADAYLQERGEPGVWCRAFMENNIFQTIFGISWILHKDIIFDIGKGQLGIAEADCPEHRYNTDILTDLAAAPNAGGAVSMTEDVGLGRRPRQPDLELMALSAIFICSAGGAIYCGLRATFLADPDDLAKGAPAPGHRQTESGFKLLRTSQEFVAGSSALQMRDCSY